MLDRYCEKLAKDWEIPQGFTTNKRGVYTIPLEEDLEINLTNIDGGFTLSANLGTCPTHNKSELYKKLLAGNMLGQFTRGAVLSLDDKQQIVLSEVITSFHQYRDFYEKVEDFIDTIDSWQAVIETEKIQSL